MASSRWCQRFSKIDDEGKYNIFYEIDSSLKYNQSKIKRAMKEIECYSRIRFEPRRRQPTHLKITKDKGCWFVGLDDCYCGQRISFGMGCEKYGTILHELLHAIGFELEHQRRDRGEYIKINWRNIKFGNEDQFEKVRASKYGWMDFDFDFESIMMYGSYAFSRNGDMTIQKQWDEKIEENDKLSDMDKEKLGLL